MLVEKSDSKKKLLILTGNHERIKLLNIMAYSLKAGGLSCDIYAVLQFKADIAELNSELFDGVIVGESLRTQNLGVLPKQLSEQQIVDILSRDRYADANDRNKARVAYFWHTIHQLMSNYEYVLGIGEVSWWSEEVVASLCYQFGGEYLTPSSLRLVEKRWFLAPAMSEERLVDRVSFNESCSNEALKVIDGRPDYFKAGIGGVRFKARLRKFKFTNILGMLTSRKKTRLLFAKLQQLATKLPALQGCSKEKLINLRAHATKVYFFPLHTQPEASVDYLAPSFRDQYRVIEKLSKALKEGEYIVVKQHPGALHEFGLIHKILLARNERIFFVRSDVDVSNLVYIFDGCISITGTLAAQFALAGVPSVTLVPMFFNSHPLCSHSSPMSWRRDIEMHFYGEIDEANINFLEELTSKSFPGYNYHVEGSGFDPIFTGGLVAEIVARINQTYTSNVVPRLTVL